MNRNLMIGDTFRTSVPLQGSVAYKEGTREPYADPSKLRPREVGGFVTCSWTERNGVWTRSVDKRLDLNVAGTETRSFRVVQAGMGGGGYGHGEHDVYPDVWQVSAVAEDDPTVTLRFSQKATRASYGNSDAIAWPDVELVDDRTG